jgi:hypothetical protein
MASKWPQKSVKDRRMAILFVAFRPSFWPKQDPGLKIIESENPALSCCCCYKIS